MKSPSQLKTFRANDQLTVVSFKAGCLYLTGIKADLFCHATQKAYCISFEFTSVNSASDKPTSVACVSVIYINTLYSMVACHFRDLV